MNSVDKSTNKNVTLLDNKYGFWYRISDEALQFSKFQDAHLFEDQVKKIADIESVS